MPKFPPPWNKHIALGFVLFCFFFTENQREKAKIFVEVRHLPSYPSFWPQATTVIKFRYI